MQIADTLEAGFPAPTAAGWYTDEDARKIQDRAAAVFNAMTTYDRLGQREEQGVGNYYETDPTESRNYNLFLDHLDSYRRNTGHNEVLIAGCGDGLELELPRYRDYNLSGFDASYGMVDVCAQRLAFLGQATNLVVKNAIDLSGGELWGPYAGVAFAQMACFIPPTEGDWFMRRAIGNTAMRLRPGGLFYFSTTERPPGPVHVRTWRIEDEVFGSTLMFARSPDRYAAILRAAGIDILAEDYAEYEGPTGPYINYYFIGCQTEKHF